jgi:hypothetical protein
MTEIELHREQAPVTPFGQQVEQARLLSAGSMLPGEYRNQPANVLIAMNLGQAMGLSPAESLYRIAVIKGKPTASAELIASNVRKAGHRLRVAIDEQAVSATATIVRSDDPDYEFSVTRDMKWARDMGLASNDNYRKQPLTMLANRAITAVARLACSETLYGVAYSPDEMHEADTRPRGGLASVLDPDPSPASSNTGAPVSDRPLSDEEGMRGGTNRGPGGEPSSEGAGEDSPYLNTRSGLARRMFAAINAAGISEEDRLTEVSAIIGRTVTTSKEMTEADAEAVIATMEIREVHDAEIVEDELPIGEPS